MPTDSRGVTTGGRTVASRQRPATLVDDAQAVGRVSMAPGIPDHRKHEAKLQASPINPTNEEKIAMNNHE
jgi:hypothetical protein